jgi:hypothetical protein
VLPHGRSAEDWLDDRATLLRAEGRCPARQNEVSVRNRSTTAHYAPAPSHMNHPRSAH